MRRIIKNGAVVADRWTHVGGSAGGPLPDGDIVVPLETWRATRGSLLRRNSRLGVRLAAGDDPAEIAGDLDRLDLIALEFPSFADGRAYSAARLLRERYGYAGELRAVGDVLRDQLYFMRRCGFDAFELRPGRSIYDALAAFSEISVKYQGAADGPRG